MKRLDDTDATADSGESTQSGMAAQARLAQTLGHRLARAVSLATTDQLLTLQPGDRSVPYQGELIVYRPSRRASWPGLAAGMSADPAAPKEAPGSARCEHVG
jgi:hypothetical protein